jgi:hypothetical protein
MAACLKLVRFGPNFFADRIVVALGITKDTVRHLPDGPFENGSRILHFVSFGHLPGVCDAADRPPRTCIIGGSSLADTAFFHVRHSGGKSVGKKAGAVSALSKNETFHATRGEPERISREPPGRARTLGPVSDLERHLPSEWWRTLFNSLYLETDGDVVENDRNTEQEVDLLVRSAGLERSHRILDLCCGQGRHALELARRGFSNVTGLDRSRYLIRLARKRAKQRHLAASFHEGDARRFRLGEGEFNCVCVLAIRSAISSGPKTILRCSSQ